MTLNILIGVGGTGAKIVEASLHAATAGLLGPSLSIGLVDQDRSNGNVSRTSQLLEDLVEARALWRSSGRSHVLGDSPLFHTDIRAFSTPVVWTPHPDRETTLAGIFGRETMVPAESMLFDGLFGRGEGLSTTEQDLPLDKGYRGRAHIGAAAMAARRDDDIEFWNALKTAIDAASGSTEVRILLAGSVFGGTGAAGFPTLARLIRRKLPEGAGNIKIGGVLMLPYFGFAPPRGSGIGQNVARSEDLIIQSKSALKHYDMLKIEGTFDQLYLVGWDQPFELGYHEEGDNDQINPPLAPELLAALAACRFFQGAATAMTGKVLVSAREDAASLGWPDLPSPSRDRSAPYLALARLLRFCVAWKYWGPVVAQPRSERTRAARHDPWYRRQAIDLAQLDQTPFEAEVKALDAYADRLLTWAGGVEMYARNADLDFRLWNTNAFVTPGLRPNDPLRIPASFGERDYPEVYNNIIRVDQNVAAPPTAARLLSRLTHETGPGRDQRGLGVFVSALHAFAEVQASTATGA